MVKAAAAFQLAAECDPRVATYVKNAVSAYLNFECSDEALSVIDANILATSESPELLALRGDVHFSAENFESAEGHYDAAISALIPWPECRQHTSGS